MKTTLVLIFALAFLIYSSEPTISFKPFSISFEKPYIPFAILFLVISISLFKIQSDKDGYIRGVKDAKEIIEQVFKTE